MMKKELIIFLIIVSVPVIFAYEGDAETAQVAFCNHMGHNIERNIESDVLECIFEDEPACDATDFYQKICRTDKIDDFLLRKEGKTVFIEFESCVQGFVPSEPQHLLDQPKCVKPPFWEGVWDKIINFDLNPNKSTKYHLKYSVFYIMKLTLEKASERKRWNRKR